jgi:hypothetical protein
LLAEVGLLKERGLTVEAVVADFIFKNIQPLKDRAHPAYLYRGLADSTRVTNRRIPSADLVSRLEMILRGKVSNVGAPVAYSDWNLPPPKAFTLFVSNPPVTDGSLGLRVRPSAEEVSALVASLGECWGEGKDATLRSRPSLITAGQTETEQAGIPFARFGTRRRPATKSSRSAASFSSEAHV